MCHDILSKHCSFQIDYKGKGYFSGKPHSFKAALSKNGHSVQSFEGQWTGVSHVGSSKGPVFLDTSAPKEEVTVAPLSEQGEWESRKLWEAVANGIRTGNYDAAGKDKSRLEVSHSSFCFKLKLTIRTSNDNEERMSRLLDPTGSWFVSSTPRKMSSTSDSPRCYTTSTSPLTRTVISSRDRCGLVAVVYK